jgi:hypothetical protein
MIRQKNAIKNKIKALSFQKMEPKNGQPKVHMAQTSCNAI